MSNTSIMDIYHVYWTHAVISCSMCQVPNTYTHLHAKHVRTYTVPVLVSFMYIAYFCSSTYKITKSAWYFFVYLEEGIEWDPEEENIGEEFEQGEEAVDNPVSQPLGIIIFLLGFDRFHPGTCGTQHRVRDMLINIGFTRKQHNELEVQNMGSLNLSKQHEQSPLVLFLSPQ